MKIIVEELERSIAYIRAGKSSKSNLPTSKKFKLLKTLKPYSRITYLSALGNENWVEILEAMSEQDQEWLNDCNQSK